MTVLGIPLRPSEITVAALAVLAVWQWVVEARRNKCTG